MTADSSTGSPGQRLFSGALQFARIAVLGEEITGETEKKQSPQYGEKTIMITNETQHDILSTPNSSYRRTPVSRMGLAFPGRPFWIPAFAGMTIPWRRQDIEKQAQV